MRKNILLFILSTLAICGYAQKPEGFTTRVRVSSTNIKNQDLTGTCWSFATTSFVESELIRMKKDEFDLSEMFFVHQIYPKKARNYIRLQGKANFGEGGQAHDVMNVIRENGIMPESAYSGRCSVNDKLNHFEMVSVLKAMLDAARTNKSEKLSDKWYPAFEAVIDVYLGKLPSNFDYKGKIYTPKSFSKEMFPIIPDDYVEITSYNHHPFYEKFRLEIPDNWSMDEYYNIPIEELIKIMDNALASDYSLVWDGDVTENEFANKRGMAIVPLVDWDKKSKEEKDKTYTGNDSEKEITQAMRQESFDNYSTQDDHLMHIVGIDVDKKGTKYYITKNSWGEECNNFGGYIDLSESYVKLKTVAIMVHKNAIPPDIAKKMGIK